MDYSEGHGNEKQVAMPWQNPRDLIDREIDRLNRVVNDLHALRRGLPSEMSPQAERGLVDILVAARIGASR